MSSAFSVQSPDLNPIINLGDVVEQGIHTMKVHLKTLQECNHVNMDANLKRTFQIPCGMHSSFESKILHFPGLT